MQLAGRAIVLGEQILAKSTRSLFSHPSFCPYSRVGMTRLRKEIRTGSGAPVFLCTRHSHGPAYTPPPSSLIKPFNADYPDLSRLSRLCEDGSKATRPAPKSRHTPFEFFHLACRIPLYPTLAPYGDTWYEAQYVQVSMLFIRRHCQTLLV